MKINKVGVVGCGFMGSGITQVCAQAGYQVVVREVSGDALNKGLAMVNQYLARGVEKGRMVQSEKEKIMARIKGTTELKDLSECDLVIEVVPEDLGLKKKLFAELDTICARRTILTSNTSCLSIENIAKATKRPDKVIGTHFLSPVPPSKLLEIVTSPVVSNDTVETVKEFCASLGKEIIVAKDTPGFVFNYLLITLSNAAFELIEKGIATKEDVDKSMTLGLGHPIGPIALADFNGVDVCYLVTKAMYERTGEARFKPSPVLKKLVDAGMLGRKTGQGFYKYK
ncbi:MAG: 3-hydroxyacyl-CoA dehydrogenase family protein [Dehalococcoidales bacterium]|nr:3-hydroxyacyl-CoA dehydrogenase family protein [Dehalococcoidales bacterium]